MQVQIQVMFVSAFMPLSKMNWEFHSRMPDSVVLVILPTFIIIRMSNQGWYCVETRSNVDLTCYIIVSPGTESTATQNTDNLIVPLGSSPSRYITFTMPPVYYGPGPFPLWG
jgi:hypothetical protein